MSSLAETLMNQHLDGPAAESTDSHASSSSATANGAKKAVDLGSLESFPALGGSAPAATGSSSWGPSASGSVAVAKAATAARPAPSVRSSTISEALTLPACSSRDVLKDAVAKARQHMGASASIESSTSKTNGTTTFIIKGKKDEVSRARRDLLRSLSPKLTKVIQVPSAVRAFLIGTRGATLHSIIDKSACHIQVARRSTEEPQPVEDSDEEEMSDVTIEGDQEGIALAIEEIKKIVDSRVRFATQKFVIGDHLADYVPFIKAKFGALTSPTVTVANGAAVISGERNAVIETKQEIADFVQSFSSYKTTLLKNVSPIRQKFLSKERLLKETGSIFEQGTDKDTVRIIAPTTEDVKKGVQWVTAEAVKLEVKELDISKAHKSIPQHAKHLTLYFKNSGKLADIEKKHKITIAPPTILDGPSMQYLLVGTEKEELAEARKELVALVNQYPPSKVRRVSSIDPLFYPKVKELNLPDVEVVFVDSDDAILFIYKDKPLSEDDFGPDESDISTALNNAEESLAEIKKLQSHITETSIAVPKEIQKYVSGPNNSTLRSIIGQSIAKVTFSDASVNVRGVDKDVERIAKEIQDIVEEGKNMEVLSKYTTNFTFPPEHINKLIGKNGANLTKIREEFGVKIDVEENGNGTVQGLKKNADEAKQRIIKLGQRLADEVTLKLKVPGEYLSLLIGKDGKFVHRLEDKYDVYIKFPKPGSEGEPVTIRGPSRGATKAQEELQDLLKYEIDNNYSEIVTVARKYLRYIIGKNGENINDIKDKTETRIDIADEAEDPSNDERKITITGSKANVKDAAKQILAVKQEIDDIVTETVDVDPKYHGALIGPSGSTMKEIVEKAGGDGRMIHVPALDSGSSAVKVVGNKKVVQKIVKEIKAIVEAREKIVSISFEVPSDRHWKIIGPGGHVKRELEAEFSVSINIPQQNSKSETITVSGEEGPIEKAKARIISIVGEAPKEEVVVPRIVHSVINDRNSLTRKLIREYEIKIEHSGAPRNGATGDQAIVPDDVYCELGDGDYKWTTAKNDTPGSKSAKVTWRFSGDASKCAAAAKELKKEVENTVIASDVGYLTFAEPNHYRQVVGSAGSNIKSIRGKTSAQIAVHLANRGKEKDLITIKGTEKSICEARDLILEAVGLKE